MYQRIWVGQPQSCCHRVLKTTRRCANSRQHTSWQPKGSNCEKAPGHTISYDTLSHPEILLYVWQHIVAKVGEYNPEPGIPENTDVHQQAVRKWQAEQDAERLAHERAATIAKHIVFLVEQCQSRFGDSVAATLQAINAYAFAASL